MNPASCSREEELLSLLMNAQWPDCAEGDLRDHVAGCGGCSDLALVAGTVLSDRHELESQTAPLSSGAIWWRMQLRREQETRAAAARTVLRVQSLAIALTLVSVIVAASFSSLLPRAWVWLVSARPEMWTLPEFSSSLPSLTAAFLVVSASIILAPVALYLAIAEE